MPRPNQKIIDSFHKGWHESIDGTWHKTRWRGVKVLKCPFDLHIYQELIHRIKPDLIIETGTCFGGSSLFLADMLQLVGGRGVVVTVDIREPKNPPQHPRLKYVTGSSIESNTMKKVLEWVPSGKSKIMVILDSNHKRDHVLKEMTLYGPLVTKGSYMIVEDTNINRLVRFDHGPGPGDAVDLFMKNNKQWVVDKECEKLYMTFNPGGYLKRV